MVPTPKLYLGRSATAHEPIRAEVWQLEVDGDGFGPASGQERQSSFGISGEKTFWTDGYGLTDSSGPLSLCSRKSETGPASQF